MLSSKRNMSLNRGDGASDSYCFSGNGRWWGAGRGNYYSIIAVVCPERKGFAIQIPGTNN